jgi:RNA polymerase sigma-70 factor, ECF subfamily
MEAHQHYAFALAIRILHDEEDAKDVVQDAFVRVWNNLGKYRKEVKFTTWLYKIVVNLCFDRIKLNSRRNGLFDRLTGLFVRNDLPDGGDLEKEIEMIDLRDSVLSAARELPPMENLVFHLRDIQDFSVAEVAEIAGISVGSVKTNLCLARKRLRIAIMKLQGGGKP